MLDSSMRPVPKGISADVRLVKKRGSYFAREGKGKVVYGQRRCSDWREEAEASEAGNESAMLNSP